MGYLESVKVSLPDNIATNNSHDYDHIIWINADSKVDSTYVDIAKIMQLHDKSTTKTIDKLLQKYFKK